MFEPTESTMASLLRHQGDLMKENHALKADNARLKEDYERACKTVAEMHAAAVGEIRGPIKGVVEDVAALRSALKVLRDGPGLSMASWKQTWAHEYARRALGKQE